MLEEFVVLRAGKGEAVVEDLIAVGTAEGDALIFLLGITAPWGEPDADARFVFCGCLAGFCEAVGKAGVEAPERVGIVPAIVEEIRVELYVPLDDELLAKCVDAVEGPGLGEAIFIAEVVPGVVVEEGLIGARALGFDVCEECSAELVGLRGSDDGGVGDGLAGAEREISEEGRADVAIGGGVDGERVLEAEVEVGVDDRRAFDGAVGMRFEVGEVKQADFCQGQILGRGMDAQERARVVGSATSDEAPVEGGGGVGRGEVLACAGGRRRGVVRATQSSVGIGRKDGVG